MTALVAELHDEDELRLRYRAAVERHKTALPKWIADLSNTDVYRAVRRAHVLGEKNEIIIGARLADGQEMTCAVILEHIIKVEISNAYFFGASIASVLKDPAEQADPDFNVMDMSLADARAWVDKGLNQTIIPVRDTESWPDGRPLVQWLMNRLPEGGESYQSPAWEWEAADQLCDDFFASERGAPFDRRDHKEVLLELFESGTEDPLRWSVDRVYKVLDSPTFSDGTVPLYVILDIPELLKAFIFFAHERSGIRQGLTEQALAVLDSVGNRSRREELRDTA